MNKGDPTRFCLSLAFLTLFASTAMAADLTPRGAADRYAFDTMDANHDGYLGRSELPRTMKDLRMHFDQYSLNHRLSESAYARYLQSTKSRCIDYPAPFCFEHSGPPKVRGISYAANQPIVRARPRSASSAADR